MKNPVKDIGQQFFAETEAVAPAEGCGYGGANNDFSVGEGEHIGRRRVTQMNLVEPATFLGGNEDDAKFGRKPAVAVFRKTL